VVLLSVGALQDCLDSPERSAVLGVLAYHLDDLSLGLAVAEVGSGLLSLLLSVLLSLGFGGDVLALLLGLFEGIAGPLLLGVLLDGLLIVIIEVLLIGVPHDLVFGEPTTVDSVLLQLDQGVNLLFLLLFFRACGRAARGGILMRFLGGHFREVVPRVL
jgi:hypothetical protein